MPPGFSVTATPQARSSCGDGRDPIALLHAQLFGAFDGRSPLGRRGGHREHGQLVDARRNLFGGDRGADEARCLDDEIAERLACTLAFRDRLDAPAHPSKHRDEAEPCRVEAHALDDEPRAFDDRACHGEERRRRSVTAHVHVDGGEP